MKIKILSYLITKNIIPVLFCLMFSAGISAQEEKKEPKSREIKIAVKNEGGEALNNVQVTVGEGVNHILTEESGTATFQAYNNDFITVYKKGYEKRVFSVLNLPEDGIVELTEAKIFGSDEDIIPMPFAAYKKRALVTSDYLLKGSQLETYPSTDIRNAFAGLVPGLDVVENDGMPGVIAMESVYNFERVSMTMRGLSPLVMVDDIEVDFAEMPIDPQEIESVTVVKDIVSKAMYGPKAANGIIFIKTKRGKENERILNVNAEAGVSTIDRFPEWVSGAEYARLNNQARANDGMTPQYSDADIAAYAKGDPYDLYHPSIDFREMLLKNTRPFMRANVSASGGNDRVQYFGYVGYSGEGDNFKIGETANYNRINIRSNIDIGITDKLKFGVGIYGGVSIRKTPQYYYVLNESSANFSMLSMEPLLNDITSTPPIAFPVYASYDEKNDVPWYGVSSTYNSNPIGNLESCGYYNELTRTSAANAALDYDMSEFLPGLKSRTYISFSLLNLTRIGKADYYIAYTATPSTTAQGNDTILLAKVHDGIDNDDQVKYYDYSYQRLSFYETLSYEKKFGAHDLRLGLTYFLFNGIKDDVREPDRQQNGILSAGYIFNDKYSVQGVLNYAGTSSFNKGDRYGLFPSLGLGWVLSEEAFMQDVDFVDYLKFRANGGVLGYDGLNATFYYQERWSTNTSGPAFGPHSANQWFGSDVDNSVYRSYPDRMSNFNLGWEKRKEFNIGLEALLFNHKLYFEVDYYNNTRDGIIKKMSNLTPSVTGILSASPWYNYDKYRYHGVEMTVQYTDNVGEFRYSIGGNATIQDSKVLKYDEPVYRESYRSRIGQSVDAFTGYTYLGRYATDSEAQSVTQNFDKTLYAGDLKYLDKNNDDILDDNDRSYIGHSTPRLVYGLNVKLSYKNFDLTAVGTGRAFYDLALTNRYFASGSGDDTYSAFVRDNIGGAYPRLTYQRVNNNFQMSDYWLTSGNFFKVQNAELAYNLFFKNNRILGAQLIRFYVRGANLLTVSKVKDVDPESIDSGIYIYPLCKTFTAGIKVTF